MHAALRACALPLSVAEGTIAIKDLSSPVESGVKRNLLPPGARSVCMPALPKAGHASQHSASLYWRQAASVAIRDQLARRLGKAAPRSAFEQQIIRQPN